MKALLCKLLFSCVLAGPGAKPIDDLTYGTVLYDYFQDDYSSALVSAMVAERQQRTGADPLRFNLAKGSFAFQEGLYGLSTELFSAIDAAALTELDRLRLAFHLAREYHRRGDWEALRAELSQIDLGKRWWGGRGRQHPEVQFMRAELAIHDRAFGAAYELLQDIDRDSHELKAYGLFNLGVALREGTARPELSTGSPMESATESTKDPLTPRAVFAELAAMPARSAETHDLVQRGKLALAYLSKAEEDRAAAATVLEQLPVNGRYRNAALAAYGNLAMAQGEYELAARVWLTLKQEPYWTPSTAAARLGFPLSLENLASQDMALAQYRRAEATFVNRIDALTTLQARVAEPEWVRTLIQTFAGDALGTEDGTRALEQWQEELGHTDWLEWLSTEAVNELLVDWRELQREQAWLDALPEKLGALEEVASERTRRGREAQSLLVADDRLGERDRKLAALNALKGRLESFAALGPTLDWAWMQEIGTAEERELLADLERKAALAAEHLQEPERSRWLRRIKRLQGATLWEQTMTHASRLQARRQALADNRTLLASLDDSLTRLSAAEAQFLETVAIDFAVFEQRAEGLQLAVRDAIADREERLALEIQGGMRREMAQVQRYLMVARVAIARTTDQLAGGTTAVTGAAGEQEPGE